MAAALSRLVAPFRWTTSPPAVSPVLPAAAPVTCLPQRARAAPRCLACRAPAETTALPCPRTTSCFIALVFGILWPASNSGMNKRPNLSAYKKGAAMAAAAAKKD